MNKNLLLKKIALVVLGCLATLLLFQCQPNTDASESTTTDTTPADTKTGNELMKELRAQAVDESDIEARIQRSLEPIREAYAASEPTMDDLKDVKINIIDDCLLQIENNARGQQVTQVAIADLDPNGFGLIPDQKDGEFPGLRIRTIDQKPAVKELLNGKEVNRNNELVIKLANRAQIEKIAPVMLQILYLCQGRYEE